MNLKRCFICGKEEDVQKMYESPDAKNEFLCEICMRMYEYEVEHESTEQKSNIFDTLFNKNSNSD